MTSRLLKLGTVSALLTLAITSGFTCSKEENKPAEETPAAQEGMAAPTEETPVAPPAETPAEPTENK